MKSKNKCKWMEFDTKGYKGNGIPMEVHNEVAKTLANWLRKQGYKLVDGDMEIYLEFGLWVKDAES